MSAGARQPRHQYISQQPLVPARTRPGQRQSRPPDLSRHRPRSRSRDQRTDPQSQGPTCPARPYRTQRQLDAGHAPLRLDSTLHYDNLWQRDHQLGMELQFLPAGLKSDTCMPQFYDQPLIANYSGFYRIPAGLRLQPARNLRSPSRGLRLRRNQPRFNLAGPDRQSGMILYASRSTSETPVRFGPCRR